MPRMKVVAILSLATLLAAPVVAQTSNPARPGTLNYVEGNASIDGRALTNRSIGNTALEAGGTLATANGRAEVLLSPGVFLRVDENSEIRMISSDLTHTEVAVDRGRVEIEVDQLYPQNHIQIDEHNGQALLLKNGLYEFNADNSTMRVFDGKAAAYQGLAPAGDAKATEVKGSHQISLAGTNGVKTTKFDVDPKANSNDGLYQWSSLRSEYLGEANEKLAQEYAGDNGGYGPVASGWLWSPAFYGYTWLPGNGLFYSPFGYGFYSPYYLYGGGFYGGGYYRGGYVNRSGYLGHSGYTGSTGGRTGGFSGGGGGFHGGGGGSHGGGGGGHR